MPKLATWRNRIADNRTIHTKYSLMDSEIQFLEYRLEVVSEWPDSDRKRATILAILSQLERHPETVSRR
jgi:hypothetical protein